MRRLLPLVCWLLTGCIAIPYATPPVRVRVGGGRYVETAEETEERSALAFDLTAAIHPAQLLSAPLERSWDYGVGYRFQLLEHGRKRNGAFLEGAYFFPLNEARTGRAYVRATGDLLFRGDQPGGGGTVGGGIEWVGDTAPDVTATADEDGIVIGTSVGEGGIGLEVAAGAYGYREGPEFTVTLAVTFRLPASAGVVFAWLWELAADARAAREAEEAEQE